MPVKKKKKINASRSKKITEEERESIKQAVNSFTGTVRSTLENKNAVQTEPKSVEPKLKTQKSFTPQYHNTKLEEKKRHIVWFGVSTIMLAVAAFWVYSVKIQVKNSGFGNGSDKALWDTAVTDYTRIVKFPKLESPKLPDVAETEQTLSETDKEKMKQILTQNISLLAINSTSTSSTTSIEKIVTSTKQ